MTEGVEITVTGALFCWERPGKDSLWIYGWRNATDGSQYIVTGPRPETQPIRFKPYSYTFTVSVPTPFSCQASIPDLSIGSPCVSLNPGISKFELTDIGNLPIGQGSFGVLRPLSPPASQRELSASPNFREKAWMMNSVVKSGTYAEHERDALTHEVNYFRQVHPGISYIKFDEKRKVYHAVLPRVPGMQLLEYFKRNKDLADEEKLEIIIAAAWSIKVLHEQFRFIHGDANISNFNVMRNQTGKYEVRPLDFGSSYGLDDPAKVCEAHYRFWHPSRVGIPRDKVAQGPMAHPRHDIFSLAVSFRDCGHCKFRFLDDAATDCFDTVDDFLVAARDQLKQLKEAGEKARSVKQGAFTQQYKALGAAKAESQQLPAVKKVRFAVQEPVIPQTGRSGVVGTVGPVAQSQVAASTATGPNISQLSDLIERPKQGAKGYSVGWAALPALLGAGATTALILTSVVGITSGIGWIPLALGLLIAGVMLYTRESSCTSGELGLFGGAAENSGHSNDYKQVLVA